MYVRVSIEVYWTLGDVEERRYRQLERPPKEGVWAATRSPAEIDA
jgi:hypothetical protein